jgi:alpha-N-arabinofuranosidase
MNRLFINPEQIKAALDPNVFGGFAEHLGQCVYGGIYDPDSPLADERGLRTDVMGALRRLRMPVMRYPGGNFVSGYRWMDGVGPRAERPVRTDMAWNTIETNQFGTNEFIEFCRLIGTEPYMVVNAGDGDMREARDWVEYCNGTHETALVKLRAQHGYAAPHQVKYWGIGNEVDGPWQIGYKTPAEYARVATEFSKVMRWADPTIKIIANGVSNWGAADFVERVQLLLEGAANLIDYIAIHWYVENEANDFAQFMALSELFDARLTAFEGLVKAYQVERNVTRPIHLAVDEWNVWHRAEIEEGGHNAVIYTLEDALVVATQMNAFIRHAASVKMGNIAQIVNVLAPINTRKDGMVLQTIFYPFELYSNWAGANVVGSYFSGDTFSAGGHSGLPVLDTVATLSADGKQLVIFAINRSENNAVETTLSLAAGQFTGTIQAHVVNGSGIKSRNTFSDPGQVVARQNSILAEGREATVTFEPHSVTALVCPLG